MHLSIAAVLVIAAFVMAWRLTRVVEARAGSAGLIQAPNQRSSHTALTPRGGGIAIAITSVLACIVLAMVNGVPGLLPLAVLGSALAVLGFVDDLQNLSVRIRLPLQTIVVGLMVWSAWPLAPLTLPLGVVVGDAHLAVILILAGLWWINLFNFMDGIDGIAASQAILVLLLAGALWWFSDKQAVLAPLFWLMVATAAATGGFLVRNWPPARIFMGDAGSNFLALVIFGFALLTVRNGALSYCAWLILVSPFVSDATVTLLRRVKRGERPWQAHRRHAYQQLSRLHGHRSVSVLYGCLTLIWAGPLAIGAHLQPDLQWMWLAACYIPLIVAAFISGAGAMEEWSGARN